MSYINRERLCKDLMSKWETADKEKEKEIQSIMANIVTPIVVEQPSADVVEVKHGEWTITKTLHGEIVTCPYCGARPRESEYGYYVRDNFCSNCGADMRGEIE